MEKGFVASPAYPQPSKTRFRTLLAFALVAAAASASFLLNSRSGHSSAAHAPVNAAAILETCSRLDAAVEVPEDFGLRTKSDRFEAGTRPVLVKNATVWTGNHDGSEVLHSTDVFLDGGIIKFIGRFRHSDFGVEAASYDVIEADGSWLTPGIVDLHSHIGVYAAPSLAGASDGNSIHGVAQPWLRSLDGLNTHDASYHLSISGGVTTALILPGSANAIGGQAFPIKLRDTSERSVASKLIDPPFTYAGNGIIPAHPPRWRYLKQACGENPSRVYHETRMDNLYAMRHAYTEARKVRDAQDSYCLKATSGQWVGLGDFPESLQWEALVDVLRGRVKVNNHCYEAVDLDDIVRLTNEFKFKLAAFHHAHETYLVPDVLKKAYGGAPVSALFATHGRYKREAWRGSEFAPRVLADHGLKVVMKSDHPVIDSRHLIFEAQQAHYYGLASNLALASVTTTSADAMGLGHRIGYIRKSYDADLVLWDVHPLSLSATPKQVIIDGIVQLNKPHIAQSKPEELQKVPPTPNFDNEARKAVEYEGLPPLEPAKSITGFVAFANVSTLWQASGSLSANMFTATENAGTVVVEHGKVVCSGSCDLAAFGSDVTTVDLAGGSLAPSLITYGSPIGLVDIGSEATTQDGLAPDALLGRPSSLIGGDGVLVRAVDGLQFGGRDALLGYQYGVSTAVTAPVYYGLIGGLSTAFALGSPYKLVKGAVRQRVVALHASVSKGGSLSVSTQIAALRNLLLGGGPGDSGQWFKKAGKGEVPLVIDVEGADEIATLVELKGEVEKALDSAIKLTITGATEAHIIAKELAAAKVGVILTRPRPFPGSWSQRRQLPGHPLTAHSNLEALLNAGVTVAIGETDKALVRSARFELAWIYFESGGSFSKSDVIELSTKNVASLLGLDEDACAAAFGDFVAYHGGDIFDLSAKPIGALSAARGVVDLF